LGRGYDGLNAMKITILHNAVADTDTLADRDVLTQVAAVEDALRTLGHESRRLACTLNLEAVEEALTSTKPELVFNLVESLGGSDRLSHLAAVLLDDLDLCYTGATAATLHLANNKPRAKAHLRAAGLPTPEWITAGNSSPSVLGPPYIIKAIWEHASLGLDDHAVITDGDGTTVCDQIESRSRQLGQVCFAEKYIEGREFNLSIIGASDGPRVLPPAEIDFSAFPEGKPRIVGYAAKWEEKAMENAGTPRHFDFTPDDAPLLDWLRALAVQCWQLFDLSGYARVDFRVDGRGQPWILEVNANPCLSPDAGFAAALARANLPIINAVQWIVEDALRGRGAAEAPAESGPAATPAETLLSTTYIVAAAVPRNASKTVSVRPARQKQSRGTRAPKLRTDVRPSDAHAIRKIVEATGLFRAAEVDVAVELVADRLGKGAASGYEFTFAEQGRGAVVGYVCFGKNTLTVSSYDIYWIAVDPAKQGQGVGRVLLAEAEKQIAAAGGQRVYIETSHRADYEATRGFYERCGYTLGAILEDFYAPGDGKATYVKMLSATPDS
jgi:D-alanine-D-alanine ligase-like ATP-grasp enzyme/ribosomal protein S18 acetylase RimI-like enzyme